MRRATGHYRCSRIDDTRRFGDGVAAGKDLHYRDGIIVEDSRNVFGRELVGCVADEKARLADSTVTDDDAPVEVSTKVSIGIRRRQ